MAVKLETSFRVRRMRRESSASGADRRHFYSTLSAPISPRVVPQSFREEGTNRNHRKSFTDMPTGYDCVSWRNSQEKHFHRSVR